MSKDYDPTMHTAEHVLNQTMIRMFGTGRCFSSHLNPKKSKCDYRFDRDLTNDEAAALQETVNAVLARHLPVTERFLPRSEAENLVDLGKLPASVGPDAPIRLVSVGEYDICPCIGAHAVNTEDVGAFRLVSHDFTPDTGVLRLRYVLE
ncbi:MAG: hypothetical protein DELT_01869 [Desulfovibrio sp.]